MYLHLNFILEGGDFPREHGCQILVCVCTCVHACIHSQFCLLNSLRLLVMSLKTDGWILKALIKCVCTKITQLQSRILVLNLCVIFCSAFMEIGQIASLAFFFWGSILFLSLDTLTSLALRRSIEKNHWIPLTDLVWFHASFSPRLHPDLRLLKVSW